MSGKYDDMLHLPHHVSPTRRRMTMAERAAQFSPFAALVGYEDAVRETGRVVGQRVELSDEEKAVLDRKQRVILEAIVTYFRPDSRKDGGEYVRHTGAVKKVREIERALVFVDGVEVPFGDVVELAGDLFLEYLED